MSIAEASAQQTGHAHGWRPLALGFCLIAAGVGLGAYLWTSAADSRAPAPARADLAKASLGFNPSTPPALNPQAEFLDLTPAEAEAWNAAIPVDPGPNPAARPFRLAAAGPFSPARAVDCLTAAIYYEAAGEGADGGRAVAQVVLNRLRHPAFAKTVCGVVFEGAERTTGCQFTFTCDGSLGRAPTQAGWAAARRIAEAALQGAVYRPVGHATHYHTRWVVPYWASGLAKIGDVGAHIFYRWKGVWGAPQAFNAAYAGVEPDVAALYAIGAAPFQPPQAQLTPVSDVVGVEPPIEATVETAAPVLESPALSADAAPETSAAALNVPAPQPVVNPVAAAPRRPRLPVPVGW